MDSAKEVWVVEDSSDDEPEENADERPPKQLLSEARDGTYWNVGQMPARLGEDESTSDEPYFVDDTRMADMMPGSLQRTRHGPALGDPQHSSAVNQSRIAADSNPQFKAPLAGSNTFSSPKRVDTSIVSAEIKNQLRDHFRNITEKNPLACHEPLKDAPNPGLTIDGFGDISFPLSNTDIGRIKIASNGPPIIDSYD